MFITAVCVLFPIRTFLFTEPFESLGVCNFFLNTLLEDAIKISAVLRYCGLRLNCHVTHMKDMFVPERVHELES